MASTEQLPESSGPSSADEEVYLEPWYGKFYVGNFLVIMAMAAWPWVFFGIVFSKHGGLPMQSKVGTIVNNNPTDTTYFVTAICSVFAFIVTYGFSTAVTALSIKWITSRHTNVFALSFFAAFKAPTFDWVWSGRKWFFERPTRLRHAIVVLLYFILFLLVTSAFTALLTPQPIARVASLSGTELDFASSAPDCAAWYLNNLIPDACDWAEYNNFTFTTCLGQNQMVDVLESGRSNILSSIPNNNDTLTFNQLGGVHFLGPIRGVLPIGPNGVSAFDTLQPSPLSDGRAQSALAYNYTVNLQGLASNVTCVYDTQSPIVYGENTATQAVYSGTCPTGHYVLNDPFPPYSPPTYVVPTSNNSLGFWACNSSSTASGASYDLYFSGSGSYATAIGNMTCAVSSARPAIFPVTYAGERGFFTTNDSVSPPVNTSNEFIDEAVRGLGQLIWDAQGLQLNSAAETILTFGVKDFGLQPYTRNDEYLRVFEAMIQGVMEYQATYVRLIYSYYNLTPSQSDPSAPASCFRDITGNVIYNVTGWQMTSHTAAYLVPLTLVNLTSLGILIAAAFFVGAPNMLPRFDPTNAISLLVAASRGHLVFPKTATGDPDDPEVLEIQVRYEKVGDVYALKSVEGVPPSELTSEKMSSEKA